MRAHLPDVADVYSVAFWFRNALPVDVRPVTAYLFSHGTNRDDEAAGDHLGIGGTFAAAGRLIFFNGNKANTVLAGSTPVARGTWNHVVLVRERRSVRVYLNGNPHPEISGEADVTFDDAVSYGTFFFGGRCDNFANLEGRIDEMLFYDRALKPEEAVALFTSAGPLTPSPGTPGEGRGGGSSSIANQKPKTEDPISPHPNPPPEYRERGQEEQAARSALHPDPPKSPQNSMAAMKLKDGFEIELVAAEPMVMDPVALAWGPDGRLWVAEYADYPYGVRGDMKKPGGSRVRVLEDTDGDGKYDKSTLFLEGLNFANGVLPWRKGVIVTAAPEIIYAEDTDGDGKADKKEVLYTGFTEGNPQLRVNGLRWGLDNWVYCANGWSSTGKVRSVKTGKEIDIAGRDLRIRPDTGEIEAETGMTEYGRDRDDSGEWFGCDNSHPMWHFVLSDRYTRRNPHVAPPDPRVQLMVPANPRVFPIRKPEKRYHSWDQANHFTSACSTMVYRDELLFPRDDDNRTQHAFVCEPVHNLVHHEVMTPDGVTFKCARPADEQTSDFLASSDTWFRPSMVTTGPDGALWVADMYRFMIEHPDWLNDEGKADYKPFYRLGEERGRIYRIFPKGRKPRQIPRMDRMRTIELCRAAMDSPSGWQRDTAQMLLLWNKARMVGEARGELQGVVYGSQNPLARMQALCTLDGLGALRPEVLVAAIRDDDPAVRRHAVRIAETMGNVPEVVEATGWRVGDEDVRVRLQVACTLGEWKSEQAGKLLAKLAKFGASDRYVAAAVVSSALTHFDAVVGGASEGVNAAVNKTDAGGPLVRGLLFTALGAGRDAEMATLVSDVFNTDSQDRLTVLQMDLAADWLDAMDARGKSAAQWLDGLDKAATAKLAESLRPVLSRAFIGARRAAASADGPPAERAAAARLLGREAKSVDEDRRLLRGLLSPRTAGEIQRAAVSSLARLGGDELPAVVLAGWASHSPELRGTVVDALLRRETWSAALLDAIEKQQVSPADIDVPRRQRLLESKVEKIKQRAQALLGGETATNRQKVVEAHRGVLSMIDKADGTRGAKLFAQNCAVCHRVNDVGQDVGPNLASVRGWTPEMLLTGVLDPNRQVDPKYVAYTVTLNSGETIYGVITAETGGSLTMKGLDGKERPVVRSEVKSIASTGKSLMPDGFESAMKDSELADLILFVKSPDGVK
jgi:putative membrane-bound dehydrogenase-like protein